MMRGLLGTVGIGALLALPVACGGGNLASELAQPPEYNPTDQTKCKVKKSQEKPLIVEWPSADRAELEAVAKQAAVVVAYDGCEMRVLSNCQAPGKYVYTAVTPKDDTERIRFRGRFRPSSGAAPHGWAQTPPVQSLNHSIPQRRSDRCWFPPSRPPPAAPARAPRCARSASHRRAAARASAPG